MSAPQTHRASRRRDEPSRRSVAPSSSNGRIVLCSARPNLDDMEGFLERELVAQDLATLALPEPAPEADAASHAEWMCCAIQRMLATPLTCDLSVALLGVANALPGMLLCASRAPTMLGALVSCNGVPDGVDAHALACIDVPVLLLVDSYDPAARSDASRLQSALRCKQRLVQIPNLLLTSAGRLRLVDEALAWVTLYLSDTWMRRRYVHGAAVARIS